MLLKGQPKADRETEEVVCTCLLFNILNVLIEMGSNLPNINRSTQCLRNIFELPKYAGKLGHTCLPRARSMPEITAPQSSNTCTSATKGRTAATSETTT